VKAYTITTLEAIARNELKKYDPALVVGEPCAIPIEDIVEHHYRLEVEYRFLRKNGQALGCTVFDDTLLPFWVEDERRYALLPVKGGTIVVSAALLQSRTDGRLRFTFAHELAHWLLHKELYAGAGLAAASAIKTSLEENPAVERQADILATALLMPAGQVKRAFYAERGAKDPAASLAERFGVSKQAMGIFLRDHSLS
jgi:Zn-dependent protease with chaperone function